MALFLTSLSGDGVQYTIGGSADAIVMSGALITSNNYYAVALTGNDQAIIVQGALGGSSAGVAMGASLSETSRMTLTVGLTGQVTAEYIGVLVFGDAKRVVNHGEILGGYSDGIQASGALTGRFVAINTGTISGGNNGISVFSLGAYVVNSGTISGVTAALATGNGDDKAYNSGTLAGAVTMGFGNDLLSNTGEITGDVTTGSGNDTVINAKGSINGAINFSLGEDVLRNLGNITGNIDFGTEKDVLVNRGTILGDVDMGEGGTGIVIDQVLNRGLLSGKVTFGSTNDLFDNRGGTMDGQVFMGDGNDTFDNRGGTVLDMVFMGSGDDRYVLGLGPQVVDGGIGVDTLDLSRAAGPVTFLLGTADGQVGLPDDAVFSNFENVIGSLAGSNTISGNAANNILTGGRAADSMNGGSGNDTLNGGAGNDVLSGSTGDDTISGGIGNDTITGGAGRDLMDGGTGTDTFVFATGDTSSNVFDEITAFSSVEKDIINLLAVDANANVAGDQAFTFIGTAVFSNVAGQLRVHPGTPSGGGIATFIDGDTNGDGVADFSIALIGNLTLAATDFVL